MAYVITDGKKVLGCKRKVRSGERYIQMDYSQFRRLQDELGPYEVLERQGRKLVKVAYPPAEPTAEEAKAKRNMEKRLKRKQEYPPIGDQLDAIMKWIFSRPDEDFTLELNSLAAKCMSVKSKYKLED